jgi:hypothetical protein
MFPWASTNIFPKVSPTRSTVGAAQSVPLELAMKVILSDDMLMNDDEPIENVSIVAEAEYMTPRVMLPAEIF